MSHYLNIVGHYFIHNINLAFIGSFDHKNRNEIQTTSSKFRVKILEIFYC